MKIKYIGQSFGVDSLTNGKIYECLAVSPEGWLQVVDDSGEDYCYSGTSPAPLDGTSPPGKWEVVEDNKNGDIAKIVNWAKDKTNMEKPKKTIF